MNIIDSFILSLTTKQVLTIQVVLVLTSFPLMYSTFYFFEKKWKFVGSMLLLIVTLYLSNYSNIAISDYSQSINLPFKKTGIALGELTALREFNNQSSSPVGTMNHKEITYSINCGEQSILNCLNKVNLIDTSKQDSNSVIEVSAFNVN